MADETDESGCVQYVLSLERYISDVKHRQQLGIESADGAPIDVIQMTVYNGVSKIKTILHPNLNYLVQKNQLQAGSSIKITDTKVHSDEKSERCSGIVIVKHLTVVEKFSNLQEEDLSNIPWEDSLASTRPAGPLTSTRGYFVDMWSSIEMFGDEWKTEKPLQNGLRDREDDIFLLRELQQKVCPPNPVLLVRVLMKSRLFHYAHPQKDGKFPLQARFLVGDSSGLVTMVLWNKQCVNWYNNISVGDVLMLRKAVTKSQYQPPSEKTLKRASTTLRLLNFDLSVNSHHPEAEVTKIDPQSVPDAVGLPEVRYKLVSRRTLGLLPDEMIVDVAGIVVHVGRYERLAMETKHGEDSGAFWIRQWVYLRDGSSQYPIMLQIYRASIGMKDETIKPGQLLIATNMRVLHTQCRRRATTTPQNVCVTSTIESQIEIKSAGDEIRGTLAQDRVILDLLDWSRSDDYKQLLRSCTVGGYCQGLPLPTTRKEVWKLMGDDQPLPCNQWIREFSTFKFREVKRIAVFATLGAISYHSRMNLQVDNQADKPDIGLWIDSKLKDNLQNFILIGQENIQEESYPMAYTRRRWPALKQRLDFPSMNIQTDRGKTLHHTDAVDIKELDYFVLNWMAINEPILLKTQFICQQTVHKNFTLLDILSANLPANSDNEEASFSDFRKIVRTGNKLEGKKMFVVIDCYQIGDNKMELMCHRAFLVEPPKKEKKGQKRTIGEFNEDDEMSSSEVDQVERPSTSTQFARTNIINKGKKAKT